MCSDTWFDQYVFQAAVEAEYLGALADLAAQEPITLAPWDPMGTLALGAFLASWEPWVRLATPGPRVSAVLWWSGDGTTVLSYTG